MKIYKILIFIYNTQKIVLNPKDTEIEYQGVKTTIGELTIEQAQDMIFELLNERKMQTKYFKKCSCMEDYIACKKRS